MHVPSNLFRLLTLTVENKQLGALWVSSYTRSQEVNDSQEYQVRKGPSPSLTLWQGSNGNELQREERFWAALHQFFIKSKQEFVSSAFFCQRPSLFSSFGYPCKGRFISGPQEGLAVFQHNETLSKVSLILKRLHLTQMNLTHPYKMFSTY